MKWIWSAAAAFFLILFAILQVDIIIYLLSVGLFKLTLVSSKQKWRFSKASTTKYTTYFKGYLSEFFSIVFAILSNAFSIHRESKAEVSSQGIPPDFLHHSLACC